MATDFFCLSRIGFVLSILTTAGDTYVVIEQHPVFEHRSLIGIAVTMILPDTHWRVTLHRSDHSVTRKARSTAMKYQCSMSFSPPSQTSCHYRTQLCRILKISPADVIDLADHIDCGQFISAGGSGQIFKGKWKGVSVSCLQAKLPDVVVKVFNIPPLKNENQKIKRYRVSCGLSV